MTDFRIKYSADWFRGKKYLAKKILNAKKSLPWRIILNLGKQNLAPLYVRKKFYHQHGVTIQSSVNLAKTFLRIYRIWKFAQTWILERVIVYLPSFISQIKATPSSPPRKSPPFAPLSCSRNLRCLPLGGRGGGVWIFSGTKYCYCHWFSTSFICSNFL